MNNIVLAKGDGRVPVQGVSNINILGRIPTMYPPPPGSTLYGNFDQSRLQGVSEADSSEEASEPSSPSRVRRETEAEERERRFNPFQDPPSSPDSDYRQKQRDRATGLQRAKQGSVAFQRESGKRKREEVDRGPSWSPSPYQQPARSHNGHQSRRPVPGSRPRKTRSVPSITEAEIEDEEIEQDQSPGPSPGSFLSNADMAENWEEDEREDAALKEPLRQARFPGLRLPMLIDGLASMTGRPIEDLKITGNSVDSGAEALKVTALFEKIENELESPRDNLVITKIDAIKENKLLLKETIRTRDSEYERLKGIIARRDGSLQEQDVMIQEQDAEIDRLNGLRREQAETIRRNEAEIERLRAVLTRVRF